MAGNQHLGVDVPEHWVKSPPAALVSTPRSVAASISTLNGTSRDEVEDGLEAEGALDMSGKECQRLATEAKRMTERLLEATDLLTCGIPWKLVHEKHGISLFRPDVSAVGGTNVPCNVHAACKFACTIEDVAASLITRTTPAFKEMMAMLSSDFLDGAVVQSIVEPSESNPHRYVALKWAAFKSSGPFNKDRDMLMLEYVDMIEDAQGQKVAFRIMESVATPMDRTRFAESPKYTRDHVPLMGFMYHSTSKPDELRMTYTCNFDKNGDLPAWAANSAIQSHVEKCISGILKYTENFRVTREAIVLPQQVIPMSEHDHCRLCSAKFGVLRRSYNCLKCGGVFCAKCSSVRSAQVPEVGQRQLRVCTACVLEARRSSRNAITASISSVEPPLTPAWSCTGSSSHDSFAESSTASTSDAHEVSSTLGRTQSFSNVTGDVSPPTQKRRSYDDVLDPVRSRLIEYKTFSSGGGESRASGAPGASVGVPKGSFPGRSFSDGLIMRKEALFGAKRRGSPADLAISIEAFRQHQMRMGNVEQQPEDGDDTSDDEYAATNSFSRLPTEDQLLSPLNATRPMIQSGRSRKQFEHESSNQDTGDEEARQFTVAMQRAQNIIVAAECVNNLAQHARMLSHHRVVALQREHQFMAPMLRDNNNTGSTGNNKSPVRRRHRRTGSNFEVASSPGAVLYSNQESVGR